MFSGIAAHRLPVLVLFALLLASCTGKPDGVDPVRHFDVPPRVEAATVYDRVAAAANHIDLLVPRRDEPTVSRGASPIVGRQVQKDPRVGGDNLG